MSDRKKWAREHLRGIENCTFPSFAPILSDLDEEGIRLDIRQAIAHGFVSTLCTCEAGLTLDEASRDTKLTTEQLLALEEERFGDLLGDVYVRGSLRTYAGYLGLSGDKVVGVYAQHVQGPPPPLPPAGLGRIGAAIAATRIRDNQRLLIFVALTVLLVAVVFGFVSRKNPAPAPAPLSTVAAPPDNGRQIVVAMTALKDVQVTVTTDGTPATYQLQKDEERSFSADATLIVQLAEGASVQLTVNGSMIGTPGHAGQPWQKTFSFQTSTSGASSSPSA